MSKDNPDVFIHPRNRALSVSLCGLGNSVHVDSPNWHGCIIIYGSGNTVRIAGETSTPYPACIRIGLPDSPCFNCSCSIGRGTGFAGGDIMLLDDNSSVDIGEDCMFSTGVHLWCSDSHAVYDGAGNLRLGRFISIGNHVWVGMDVKIGKNCRIADGCIVGWGSVVTGCFDDPGCLVAGAPAMVRKSGVSWHRERATTCAAGRREAMAAYRAASPAKAVIAPGVARYRLYCLFRSLFSFTASKRARYREKAGNLRAILGGLPF